jgi:hypothetical protein
LRRKTQQATLVAALAMASANTANATDLNAGYVLDKMNNDQMVSYVAGVIEGLAYSRFLRDRPSEESMNCVYRWHANRGKDGWLEMEAWFRRHEDKPVGVLLHVLIKKECGE